MTIQIRNPSPSVVAASVDLQQYEPRQSLAIAPVPAATAAVSLALVLAGRGSRPVHQQPAPVTAVVEGVRMISSAPRPRCEAPGGEGVAGDVLPGASAPAPR